MSAIPRPYPLLARLRYAYLEAGGELSVVENAWWERRWDGGRALGAVVEAMAHPRTPYRMRVHLRLKPDDTPQEMEVTLLRPDGEGHARYTFLPDTAQTEGVWEGRSFRHAITLPPGYSVAPHAFAADGLHFRDEGGSTPVRNCFALMPHRGETPLMGRHESFTVRPLDSETLNVGGKGHPVRCYHTAYAGADAPPAEFRVAEGLYPLHMTSRRRTGESVEIVCTDFRTESVGEIQSPGDGL